MKIAAILAFFCASVALSSAGRVVCYFQSWTIYRPGDGKFGAADIDPTLCTHIIYTYTGLYENGTIKIMDDWEITGLHEIENLVALKEVNPDLKILFSMGGYNEGSAVYSLVAADPELRAVLIDGVLTFIADHMLDGFDLDWNYPGQREGSDPINDPTNFVTLLTEIKTAFTEPGYILSAGVGGTIYNIDLSYPDGLAVADAVDMLNVKTYDIKGDWDMVVGHHSGLYPSSLDVTTDAQSKCVSAGIQRWIDIGADPAKINIGIATYGRTFTLADAANAELYAPITGSGDPGPYSQIGGELAYQELCGIYSHWVQTYDEEQMVPHSVNGDQWAGYDDVMSIEAKIGYANDMMLGGAAVWTLDMDDFKGTCGDPYPLLTTINANLN